MDFSRAVSHSPPLTVTCLQGDSGNNMIRRINLTDNSVTTLAGSPTQAAGHADGVGTLATFYAPASVALDDAVTYAILVSERF